MKPICVIAMYLVGLFLTHIPWLMLAQFCVSSAFYLTLICQLLHIVLIFTILKTTSVSGDYVALLYIPKFTCNIVFTCRYLCLLHIT